MTGRISVSNDSYQVNQDGNGIIYVPKSSVRFRGSDLRSVYTFLENQLPADAAADDHVRLGHWCITNKLFAEARFELQTALKMEPGRDDLRRNLSLLDNYIKRPSTTAKQTKALTPAERQSQAMGVLPGDMESLGGLSREGGQQFTRKIQPILIHNCTNSACHGPLAEHPLKFTIVGVGSAASHAISEKNLHALLKYLNRQDPKSSPLWKVLNNNHGAQGSSIFTGSKGPQQLQAFKDWVLSISNVEPEDLDPDLKPKSNANTPSRTRRTLAKSDPKTRSKTEPAAEATPDESSLNRAPIISSSLQSAIGRKPKSETVRRTTARTNTRGSSTDGIQSDETNITEGTAEAPPEQGTGTYTPEVESIVSKSREPVPELPPEDPFDPEVFNRKQRIKQNTPY